MMESAFDQLGLFIWALSSNQRWAENSNQILTKEALPKEEGEIYEVCCWVRNFRNWGMYLRAIMWITWTTTGSILGSNLFATIWFCWFTCDCHLLVWTMNILCTLSFFIITSSIAIGNEPKVLAGWWSQTHKATSAIFHHRSTCSEINNPILLNAFWSASSPSSTGKKRNIQPQNDIHLIFDTYMHI